MTRPLVISWGELLWDLFSDGPRLGGAAANVAYHLAALGAHAVLVSRVGDDELGHEARARLEAAGVDIRFVQVDPARPTGTVNIELQGGEPRFRIGEIAAWDRIELSRELLAVTERADAICYGTLAQRTAINQTTLRNLLDLAPVKHRVCDLNLRPPHFDKEGVDQALALATSAKLNEAELERVLGLYRGASLDALWTEHGLEPIAITRGRNGARLWTHEREWEHPGFAIDEARGDRVGAGDAFMAVLVLGLVEGVPPPELLERANRYAARVASEPGAMPPRPGS